MLKSENDGIATPREDQAIEIGVAALTFIAGDPVQFNRFLDLSGLGVADLRSAAADPSFFAGLLDFILGHEPTLLAFAGDADLRPESVLAARETLGGSFEAGPR